MIEIFLFFFVLLISSEILFFIKKKKFIHLLLETYYNLFKIIISNQNESIKQKLILNLSVKLFFYSLKILFSLLIIFLIFYIFNKLSPNFIDLFFSISGILFSFFFLIIYYFIRK